MTLGALVFLCILASVALGGLAWLFTIAPLAAIIMVAIVAGLVLASARRSIRRVSPFGGYTKPEPPRVQFDGDNRCPNCCRPIEDHDAVRAHSGIVWHERCARQMEAAGLWDGAK